MQQIYRRTPRLKCDFNKVAKQLYGNHTSAWVLSCKFAAYFRNNFLKSNSGRLLVHIENSHLTGFYMRRTLAANGLTSSVFTLRRSSWYFYNNTKVRKALPLFSFSLWYISFWNCSPDVCIHRKNKIVRKIWIIILLSSFFIFAWFCNVQFAVADF